MCKDVSVRRIVRSFRHPIQPFSAPENTENTSFIHPPTSTLVTDVGQIEHQPVLAMSAPRPTGKPAFGGRPGEAVVLRPTFTDLATAVCARGEMRMVLDPTFGALLRLTPRNSVGQTQVVRS